MYQIRKVESYTILRHTETAYLDPEKFRQFGYNGDSEEEFLNFISELDIDDIYEDLDKQTLDELVSIKEDYNYTEYYNSAWDDENSWFEIGEENKEYSKYGGFDARHTTQKF